MAAGGAALRGKRAPEQRSRRACGGQSKTMVAK